jgi:hypothetical protein
MSDGLRDGLERILTDEIAKSLPLADWAIDPLPSCRHYSHVNPDWLRQMITEARAVRALLAEHPATPAEEVAEVAVEGLTVRELVAELAMGPVEHFDLPAMDVLATRFAIHGAALTAKAKAEGRVEALREAADDEAWEWDPNAEAVRDWLRERADREAT